MSSFGGVSNQYQIYYLCYELFLLNYFLNKKKQKRKSIAPRTPNLKQNVTNSLAVS